jgi:hypothetical protein
VNTIEEGVFAKIVADHRFVFTKEKKVIANIVEVLQFVNIIE